MNLRKLIDFFPYIYKERDTYKVNGHGILERFLEICGTYLEEYITPDIENELELIDLDKVPQMYLNYLWEYLGSIPFAYGVSIDKDKFDKYYNGLKSKEELEALSKVWVIQKKGPVVLNETKVRNILKYAITLTKIRGTKIFFETIFKLYGFDCTVSDDVNKKSVQEVIDYLLRTDVNIEEDEYGNVRVSRAGPYDPMLDDRYHWATLIDYTFDSDDYVRAIADEQGYIVAYLNSDGTIVQGNVGELKLEFNGWLDDKPIFDSEYYKFDTSRFDEDPRCSQCITAYFDITSIWAFMDINGEYFRDSKAILFCGKYDGLLDLYSKVKDYNNIVISTYNNQDDYFNNNEEAIFTGSIPASLSDFVAFRNMLKSFFDRYLPYNVKAHITYHGYEVDDKVNIRLESYSCYDDHFPNTIFIGKQNYVSYLVQVTSNWSGTDLRYIVSSDNIHWGEPHDNLTELIISVPGTYYIKPYTEEYNGDPWQVIVDKVMLNTWYSLLYITPDGIEFGPGLDTIRLYVKGIKHIEKLKDDGSIYTESVLVPVIKILGSTKTDPKPLESDPSYTVWTFKNSDASNNLGLQKVIFAIQESVNKQVSFQLTRQPEYAFGSISPNTIAYNELGTMVTLYPQTNYGDASEYIGMKCRETGLIYGYGDQWKATRDGITHFEIVRILTGETDHDVRANSIIIENTVEHPTKFSFSVVRTTPLVVYIQSYRDRYAITYTNPTAQVYCYVNYYGTLPAGTEFNWNLRVYEDGVDTGVVLNGNPQAHSTYNVDHPCTVRFVSLQDNTVVAESTVIDIRVIHVDNRLVISPEIDGEGHWDTNMWETNWSDSDEKTSAVAKNGKAKFYLRLYTKEGLVSGAPIEVQDANWTYVSTIETGDLITIDQPGIYYLLHSETNLIVTLNIKSASHIAVDSISVEDCEVKVSEIITPNVTILPAGASDRSYTLSVEDPSKATVVGTQIVGVSLGETVLTVKSSNNKTGTSKLTIKE